MIYTSCSAALFGTGSDIQVLWVFTFKGIYINKLLAKYCLIWILFVLLFELVVLVFSLVNPVEEGDLAAKGVVQLLPGEHVLHHLRNKVSGWNQLWFDTKSFRGQCPLDMYVAHRSVISSQKRKRKWKYSMVTSHKQLPFGKSLSTRLTWIVA